MKENNQSYYEDQSVKDENTDSQKNRPESILERHQRKVKETKQSKLIVENEPVSSLRIQIKDLHAALLRLNSNGEDDGDPRNYWRLRDAVRGVQIFGGIGSGKSSGSGRLLALTYLKCGFGGIVLTGKIDEVKEWIEYARIAKRTDDLVIFEKDKPLYFNPLQYEMQREGSGKGETFNLVNLIMSIYEMGQSYSGGGGGGGSNERFWDNALRRCISRIIDLLKMAGEEISIFNIRKVLISILYREEAISYIKIQQTFASKNSSEEEKKKAQAHLSKWINNNYCLACLTNAYRKANKTEDEEELYQFIQDYFLKIFPKMPEKTRAIVEESFLGLIEPFMSGILKKHFTQGVSPELDPQQTYKEGKIIIINFPVKEYLVAGVYAQAIYKKLWQEAIERRDAKKDKLPVFQWIDEAQYFLSQQDARFQTTARSSRACTVLISQNISNYYAAIGGKSPRDEVNSLLGNLATKIFHSNNDSVTNNWAADTIGKTFRLHQSTNTSIESMNGSTTMSESLNYQFEPQQFTILKGGGDENDCKVEAIVTVAGKEWSNGKNFIITQFDQNFTL